METNLGELEVLIIAKDKKTVNDKDLEKIFEQVAEQKKLAIFLCTGEISKKTKETYRIYKNSILFQKID
jgi:galactose-1-phosphate uridylyltransferase